MIHRKPHVAVASALALALTSAGALAQSAPTDAAGSMQNAHPQRQTQRTNGTDATRGTTQRDTRYGNPAESSTSLTYPRVWKDSSGRTHNDSNSTGSGSRYGHPTDQGINGTRGMNGVNGTNRANGVDGTNGVNGTNDMNGTNGMNRSGGTRGTDGTEGTNSGTRYQGGESNPRSSSSAGSSDTSGH